MSTLSFRAIRSLALICAAALPIAASAATPLRPVPQTNRIAAQPDLAPRVQLKDHIPAWVNAASQTSAPVDLTATRHLNLVIERDPAVQAAFNKFLEDVQNPASPVYEQWLSPEQVGQLFGPTPSDVAALTAWLSSQGLTAQLSPNRTVVDVAGPLSAISAAFQTSFGYFTLGNAAHLSAMSNPTVPAALSPVIKAIANLTEVPIDPQYVRSAPQQSKFISSAAGPIAAPNLTTSKGAHYIAPPDYNTIYDTAGVLTGGNTGAKIGTATQHIAIIARARVDTTSIQEFAANTGTGNGGAYNVVVVPSTAVPAGVDPGPSCTQANDSTCATAGDQGEATLDVERVISTAPGATTDLVVSGSTGGNDGVYITAAYNVNTLKDPIMTISFGSCEVRNGSPGVTLYDNLFTTAAAGGISVFVSSGDSGAAGCYGAFANPPSSYVYAASPNVICVSQSATCVGGTEFAEGTGTYWNTTSSSTLGSAISYIPEGAWNEPTTTGTSSGTWLASSGGGTSTFITKPSYQTGITGNPTDGQRDTPDIAFSASGHDSYYLCEDEALYAAGAPLGSGCSSAGGGYFFGSYGTSAAAPGMAGLAALINTKLGKQVGNMNTLLYSTYKTTPSAFHDVTVASSGVTGCAIGTPSMCNNSSAGYGSLSTGVQNGYLINAGYDEVTGLGSLDVAAFLTAVSTPATSTTLALTVAPNPASVSQTVTLTATLTPANTTAGAPTGTVTFYSGGTQIGTTTPSITATAPYTATLTTSYATAGTYAITATYSGDTKYVASSATAVSLVVNAAPTFSVSPATSTLSITSGTAGTDNVVVTSLNSFAGTVGLTCTATGIVGATCSLVPPSLVLTATGATATGTSVLSVNAPIGTAGTVTVIVTGASGSLSVPATITVTVAAPTVTVSSSTLTGVVSGGASGNTSALTISSVRNFTGTVALTCAATGITGATCTVSPTTVTLTAGGNATTTVTINAPVGTAGSLTATVTATATPTGATVTTTATGTVTATVVGAGLSFSTPAPISITSGSATGNTTTTTLTSLNGFVGSAALTCTIATTSGGYYPPTCSVSPTSVTLTSGGTATATVTIASTTAHGGRTGVDKAGLGFGMKSGALKLGATLASLLCLIGLRRRRFLRSLAAFALLAIGMAAISGCGDGGAVTPAKNSSAGVFVVTITATGTTTGASTATVGTATFGLTIN